MKAVKRCMQSGVGLLCAAQTCAVWGEHVLFWNGLSLWAYDHLGGTRGIGIALFTITLPALFSYPAGRMVGGLPARQTLRRCGAVRVLLITLLLFYACEARLLHVPSSPAESVVVLGLAALAVLVDSFFMPVLKASLPSWAGSTPAQRGRANALLEATDAPGFVLGPPAAAYLYVLFGLPGIAFALAVSYGAALALLMRLPVSAAPQTAHLSNEAAETVEQSSTPSSSSAPLAFFLVISALSMLVLGLVQTLALPFVREVLQQSEVVFGTLVALMGVGVTLGAGVWSLSPLLRLPNTLRLLLSLAAAGAALLWGGRVHSAAFCGAAWLIGGMGFAGIALSLTTRFQDEVSAAGRTRLLGLAHTTEAVGLLVGAAIAPPLVLFIGLRNAFCGAGVSLLLLSFVGIAWLHAAERPKRLNL